MINHLGNRNTLNLLYMFLVVTCNTTSECKGQNQECKLEKCLCKPNFEKDNNGDCIENGKKTSKKFLPGKSSCVDSLKCLVGVGLLGGLEEGLYYNIPDLKEVCTCFSTRPRKNCITSLKYSSTKCLVEQLNCHFC